MSPTPGTVSIVNTAIGALPGILTLIRASYRTAPGEQPPTDAEVVAALKSAIASSEAVDDFWLAAHPVDR